MDISDDLSKLKVNGKSITQMSIKDLKKHMSMESALIVNKAISKASKRDLEKFDFNYAEVSRADEIQPVGDIFKETKLMGTKTADESVISIFGDKFSEILQWIKRWLKKEKWTKIQKELELEDDEMVIYASFLKSVEKKSYESKVFRPFVSRTPSCFFKSRDFLTRFFSVLRKLPKLEEGTYCMKTRKSAGDFKIGDTYTFPSFALGFKYEEGKDVEEGTILRLSGRTRRGHALRDVEITRGKFTKSIPERIVFQPETSFKVTKIEYRESGCIVHCEFTGDEGGCALEKTMEEFEQKSLEEESKLAAFYTRHLPKNQTHECPFPPSLSDILKIERDYKPASLKKAIRKGCPDGDDKYITSAKERKKKDLRRIAKDFNLTEEGVTSIFVYTLENKVDENRSLYNAMNNALSNRSREALLPFKDYIFYLLMGLRSLPRFEKQRVLYRGVNMPRSAARDIYREGRTLTWTSFSSASTDEDKARKFVGKRGVIFEIHGKFRGYSIGTISKFGSEEGKFEVIT